MIIHDVRSKKFAEYGRVIKGIPVENVVKALRTTPCPRGRTVYVPSSRTLESLKEAEALKLTLFGGTPAQLGYCNGHNTKLNCLEYHRSSEFNLGSEEFILLLAKESEIKDGVLDTSKVEAFRVPAGVLIEVYATSLHYAPCETSIKKPFHVLVALPKGTNLKRPLMKNKRDEDALLTASNKWLLAHKESPEAKAGAKVALSGENIDLSR